MKCVNDAAERGVKLGSDFRPAAKSESHFQNVLQNVEQNRNDIPNLRKCGKKEWYFGISGLMCPDVKYAEIMSESYKYLYVKSAINYYEYTHSTWFFMNTMLSFSLT